MISLLATAQDAAQSNYSSSKPTENQLATESNKPARFVLYVLSAFFGLLLLTASLGFGQNLSNVNLEYFTHSLTHVGTNGDTLRYEFQLGDASSQSLEVNGYDFDIDFPSLQTAPDEIIVDLSSSWLGDLPEGTLTDSYNHAVTRLNIAYELNNNNTNTGSGLIFEFMVIRQGGFTTAEAEVSIGGGLVVVENADFKKFMEEVEPSFDWSVYPNPASERLNLNFNNTTEGNVRLMGMDGTLLFHAEHELPASIDIREFPAGMYFLSLETNGIVNTKKVVLAH